MLPQGDRSSRWNKPFRRVLTSVLVGVLALQTLTAAPPGAADKWSRVVRLKKDIRVYVTLTDGSYVEGWFAGAYDSGMSVGGPDGDSMLARDLVQQVAVDHSGRRWYSIPLAVAAGAGGLAAGYAVANRTRCSVETDICSKGRGLIITAFTVGPAALAYGLSLGPAKKVIYSKPSPKR